MEIFLSWSGKKSQKIAKILKTWIPTVIQATKPFYSTDDIAKGKRWSSELAKKLEDTAFGILIMTDENAKAPWILFEAGALSKNIDKGRVCTFLFNVKETDLQGPLGQFQNTKFVRNDVLKLLKDINILLGENSVETTVLEIIFDKMWNDLYQDITKILSETGTKKKKEIRTERELLEELLQNTREIKYKHLYSRQSENISNFLNKDNSRVVYEEDTQSVVFYLNENEEYYIDIEQLNNTAEVLDFIFQINAKGWCTEKHIKSFIDCLEELSQEFFNTNAQGIFCPMGSFMKINWKTKKTFNLKMIKEK